MSSRIHGLPIVVALALVSLALVACASSNATPAGDSSTAVSSGAGSNPESTPPTHVCAPAYPSGSPTPQTVFCADPSHMQAARVTRIVDGDTIHVDLNGKEEIIRFYGDNTTEHGQPCFEEATERTRVLVGDEVRLLPDARNRDKYGRLLRYVYSPSGLSIEAEMVAEGLAHAWRSDGALRFAIIALEDEAQQRHVGCLWQ